MICRLCNERAVSPSNVKLRIYQCSRCHYKRHGAAYARYRKSDKLREVQKRYRKTAKGRAREKRNAAKKLYVGRRYIGRVKSAAEAATINAHIRSRLGEFKEGQRGA